MVVDDRDGLELPHIHQFSVRDQNVIDGLKLARLLGFRNLDINSNSVAWSEAQTIGCRSTVTR